VFLNACSNQRKPRSSTITSALLGVNNATNKEYRTIISLGLEELAKFGLLLREFDGSGDNPYYLTEKGNAVYAKYRYLQ
jgi:predicted transcriptional regulator